MALYDQDTCKHRAQLIDFIDQHHPYEVPEILVVDVHTSSAAYAEWLAEQVEIDRNE